jgi:hypothetical protein
MSVRATSLAAGLAAAALLPFPAMAKDESQTAEIAKTLNDPMTQYAVAGMLSAMSKAVLEMPVEPFVKAMERIGGRAVPDLPRDATVGDIVGTDPGQARDELIEHVPRAMKAMGGMAEAVDRVRPEIEEMAKQMKDAVPHH